MISSSIDLDFPKVAFRVIYLSGTSLLYQSDHQDDPPSDTNSQYGLVFWKDLAWITYRREVFEVATDGVAAWQLVFLEMVTSLLFSRMIREVICQVALTKSRCWPILVPDVKTVSSLGEQPVPLPWEVAVLYMGHLEAGQPLGPSC